MTDRILINRLFLATPLTLLFLTAASNAFSLDYHSTYDLCHVLHSAPGGYLVNDVNSETVCMSCHDGSASGAPEVNIHEKPPGEFFASCVDCHDTHSDIQNYEFGTNISMVGFSTALAVDSYAKIMSNYDDSGTLYNVVFDDLNPEFWNGGVVRTIINMDTEDERKVCEVCHDVPVRTTGMNPHPSDTDCTNNCHKHSNGFMRGSGP